MTDMQTTDIDDEPKRSFTDQIERLRQFHPNWRTE
jgi:hypothetical protein